MNQISLPIQSLASISDLYISTMESILQAAFIYKSRTQMDFIAVWVSIVVQHRKMGVK